MQAIIFINIMATDSSFQVIRYLMQLYFFEVIHEIQIIFNNGATFLIKHFSTYISFSTNKTQYSLIFGFYYKILVNDKTIIHCSVRPLRRSG